MRRDHPHSTVRGRSHGHVGHSRAEKKQTLTRQEAAAWLVAIAEALTAGAGEIDLAGERISLPVADQLRAEIEIKTSPGESKLEIELAWSTASAGRTGTAPEDDT